MAIDLVLQCNITHAMYMPRIAANHPRILIHLCDTIDANQYEPCVFSLDYLGCHSMVEDMRLHPSQVAWHSAACASLVVHYLPGQHLEHN